ncbi:MAG TPA: hypothetical protein VEC06_04585 [Paucimonas sp.]|nr:hypothetical protein [Paucimonas sp.]
MRSIKFFCVVWILLGLTGCGTISIWRGPVNEPVGNYANPFEPQGVIDVRQHYSYRFLNKWRISHAWLSGTNVRYCGYGLNPFKRLGGYGELEFESDQPFAEWEGVLGSISEHNGQWRFVQHTEKIYGTNPEGKFERYETFCHQFFLSSRNGFALYLIKPDPVKDTDSWIDGARPFHFKGVDWLVKEVPPRDMTGSRGPLAAPIEIWTLKIPDTPYWMVLKFSADLQYSIRERPVQHAGLLDLFHMIVASVKLERITPIDIDPLIEAAVENKRRKEFAEQQLSREEKKLRHECAIKGSLWKALDPRCK